MSDLSSWLTKQEAATAIGVATKTIERLAQEGKLQQARRRRPTGGPELVVYHPEDVARLARERRPDTPPFVLPAAPDPTRNGRGAALAVAPALAPGDDVLRAVFAAALGAVTSETSQTVSTRLFLTLAEAAAVSGLSETCLRRLIREGTVAAIRDRGLRIRRRDLEQL